MVLETLAAINVCSFLSNTDLASADTGASFLCGRKKRPVEEILIQLLHWTWMCASRDIWRWKGGGEMLGAAQRQTTSWSCVLRSQAKQMQEKGQQPAMEEGRAPCSSVSSELFPSCRSPPLIPRAYISQHQQSVHWSHFTLLGSINLASSESTVANC